MGPYSEASFTETAKCCYALNNTLNVHLYCGGMPVMGVLWYWKNVSNKNSSCAEAGQVVIDRLFMEGAGPLLHHQDSSP